MAYNIYACVTGYGEWYGESSPAQEVCGMVNPEECRIGDLYRKSMVSVVVLYRKSVVSVSREKLLCDVIQKAEE